MRDRMAEQKSNAPGERKLRCPVCAETLTVTVEPDAEVTRVEAAEPKRLAGKSGTRAAVRPGSQQGTIAEVMRTEVATLPRTASFGELPALFAQDQTSVVVVVDDDGKPLGAITARALFTQVTNRGPASLAGLDLLDASHTNVVYLREDTRMSSVLRVFARNHPDTIVVLADTGTVAGLVTHAELLRFLIG